MTLPGHVDIGDLMERRPSMKSGPVTIQRPGEPPETVSYEEFRRRYPLVDDPKSRKNFAVARRAKPDYAPRFDGIDCVVGERGATRWKGRAGTSKGLA